MQKTHPFRQFFTLDGTSTGDSDMGQDGSVTNLEFFIEAHPTDDLYITHISLIVGYGASGRPYQFGDLAALTNGVRLFYNSQNEEVDIHDAIKSNQDLFRLSSEKYDSSWEIRGVGAANDYGYFIDVDLGDFSPNYGVKLDAGSTQRISFLIRDTMAAVSGVGDSFNAIAHGFNRFL